MAALGPRQIKVGFVLVGAPAGRGRQWPRRFCVLTTGCLRFYSDPSDAMPSDELDLDSRTVVSESHARPCCFSVTGEGPGGWTELLLVAESDSERLDWLAKLSQACVVELEATESFAERVATYGAPAPRVKAFPGKAPELSGRRRGLAGGVRVAAGDEAELPPELADVLARPQDALGVATRPTVDSLHEAFRAACMRADRTFQRGGGDGADGDFRRPLLAFLLLEAQLSGGVPLPLDLSAQPSCLVHSLVPLPGGSPLHAAMRACPLLRLSIPYVEHTYSAKDGGRPFAEYEVHTSYAMRRFIVRRRYRAFEALAREIGPRMGADAPALPARSWLFALGYRDVRARAVELAAYLRQTIALLQSRGQFSPELLKFLGVDPTGIHADEEGRMALQLDRHAQEEEGWYIVDERWLKKWRLFVTGVQRMPPGELSNRRLLEEDGRPREGLELVRDYRCVGGDMWRFYELVYSAGPRIRRAKPSLYSSA